MNKYMELLEKPYLRNCEIAKLLDVSAATVSRKAKEFNLEKYPWGYSTDEIIKKFKLQSYIARMKKSLTDQENS